MGSARSPGLGTRASRRRIYGPATARASQPSATLAVRGVPYVPPMTAQPATAGASASVFDRVADEYDRVRPTYPDELVDRACELAGTGPGDEVLEIGCGTGQLTRSLLARGLRVVAVEPGNRLRSLAERNLRGAGEVDFVHAPLEEARLPHRHFRAVFSASAFHWIDPRLSWQKAADVLLPGGTLALIQYFGLAHRHSDADQQQLLAAVGRVAPDVASGWPSYRDLDDTLAGVRRRRGNISEVWEWLGGQELAQARAGELFGDVRVAAVPALLDHSAEELNAVVRTMSFHARLSPAQRGSLEEETTRLYERLGRPIRSSTVAVLVTAQRRADDEDSDEALHAWAPSAGSIALRFAARRSGVAAQVAAVRVNRRPPARAPR